MSIRLLSVNLLSSQNVYLAASIFTAELEAIVSALRYIKSITNKKMLFLVTQNPHCRPCCPSGIIPQFRPL